MTEIEEFLNAKTNSDKRMEDYRRVLGLNEPKRRPFWTEKRTVWAYGIAIAITAMTGAFLPVLYTEMNGPQHKECEPVTRQQQIYVTSIWIETGSGGTGYLFIRGQDLNTTQWVIINIPGGYGFWGRFTAVNQTYELTWKYSSCDPTKKEFLKNVTEVTV